MYVLITGKQGSGKRTLTQELQKYWGQRGMAVYSYDYLQAAYQMHDAVFMMGDQYKIARPAVRDMHLVQHLLSWGVKRDPQFWGKAVKSQVANITDKWDALNLHYMAIIPGVAFKEDLPLFPEAFRVRLECSLDARAARANGWGDVTHPSEESMDGLAGRAYFDLTIDTETTTAAAAAEMVATAIKAKMSASFKESVES